MKKYSNFVSLVLSFLLVMFFYSISVAQPGLDNVIVPYRSITQQVQSTIEKTAIIALRHVSQARSCIHRKDWARAKRDLDQAARLMESIRDDLSTSTVKDLIKVAREHLEFEYSRQVLRDLPPIYSSLDLISVYLPTDKARMHIDRAKGFLERNEKREADRELALADSSLIVIEVELPLLGLQQNVTSARRYLDAGDAGKADEALQGAEQKALALYTGLDSPLLQANRTIWLAYRSYSTTKRTNAGGYITQARSYLNRAAEGGSARTKEEIAKLSSELTDLEKKLESEGTVAESALKSAWEKSKALAERSSAYLSAHISEEETTLKGENNLIEAKLHVAYAETYQVTTSEPAKAAKELDAASSNLRKAADSSMTESADRKKIHEIASILSALKTNYEKSDAVIQERYETAKEKLNTLIQKM
jgi:hypothetical protein